MSNILISSTNPCLIVYMIDQSGSMSETIGNTQESLAQKLADAINTFIVEIALRCLDNTGIRNRFEIAVIGYGNGDDNVSSAWEGMLKNRWVVSISEVWNNPSRVIGEVPIWITPRAVSNTPMTKAFETAGEICQDWINWGNHNDCMPPMIVNISDGDATDSGFGHRNLKAITNHLKSLGTNHGNIQIFNMHISGSGGDALTFPSTLVQNNRFSQTLFEISSELTPSMIECANLRGYNIASGAKGFVYNGNVSTMLDFLNIGSPLVYLT